MDFHQVEPFAKSLLRFLESSHFSRPKPHGQFTDLMRCDRQRRICARFKRVTERSYYSREFAPRVDEAGTRVRRQQRIEARSEEHTSELQSLMRISYAVFCLKKKK